MRKLLIILIFLSASLSFGQHGHGQGGGGRGGNHGQPKNGEIFGNINDSLSNTPMGYVTIKAYQQPGEKLVGGVVSQDDGSFSIPDLALGAYSIEISFVGYKKQRIDNIKLTESKSSYQLKDFLLPPSTLKKVEVFGNTPEITYEIDKKVVNVEDMQNTAGQTALEVLENVPSIIVGADGTVTLRGSSSFTLLIDGVPTVLDPSDALAQIPANTIQDIEIITNPSAKFDAEGTSGVINIVTKKKKFQGTSGMLTGSAGLFNNYNGNASLSIRKEKVAFDINGNYASRFRPENKVEERNTVYDSLTNDLNARGTDNFGRAVGGGGLGFQWNPNNAHKLVVKSDFNLMKMTMNEEMDFLNYNDGIQFESFHTDDRMLVNIWSTSSNIYYQHNIKRNKNHYISAKAIANLRFVDQFDSTLSYDENNSLIAGNAYTELGPSNMYRFNVDYAMPVKEKYKFEAGLQAQFGRSFDDGDSYQYNDTAGVYEALPLFSSDVNYIRDVHAAYTIFGGQIKNFGFQAGMRVEYTFRKVTSDNFPQSTTINRPDYFPSAHLSYSFKNKSQLLLSYSRRIERPRSWYFEPFVTWESPYEVRSGNPDLEPTYITVMDFSFMYPLKKKKGFFSLESYYRRSAGTLQWIQTTYEPGILIKNPYNIGVGQRAGLEGSINYRVANWYSVNAGFNAYYFDLNGAINDIDFSTNSFNYNFNLRNTFDFKGWIVQVNARYRSGSVTPQGEKLDAVVGDVSLKKSFYKNKLTFNLNARNAFLTDREISYIYADNFTLYEEDRPLGPMLSLTVSLKLNNYKKFYDQQEHLDDF